MDEFLTTLWFEEPKEVIKSEPIKEKKIPRPIIEWLSALFIDKEWYYRRKCSTSIELINERWAKRELTLLHSRPVEDIILASIVGKSKMSKYKIAGTRKYALPKEVVDLILTFTR